jgi:hypothetical protein
MWCEIAIFGLWFSASVNWHCHSLFDNFRSFNSERKRHTGNLSYFNGLHDKFQRNWARRIPPESLVLNVSGCPIVISDPLPLMKRIRYRWVSSLLSIGFCESLILFSTKNRQNWNILLPVVFLTSNTNKTHDSLPLRFFPPAPFSAILGRVARHESVMAP